MPGFRSAAPLVGYQRCDLFGLPDSTQRLPSGFLDFFVSSYWGGVEVMYAQANGTIRMGGICAVIPVIVGGVVVHQATEVPNTANLGKSIFVATTPMTTGQWGWFAVSGCVPVNCNASVASDTAMGIAAAGQAGAVTAGKQLLGMRSTIAATATVAKVGQANSGSNQLMVNNTDGWFIGVYLSGTGIAAGTTITDVDPSGTVVTLSANTTAAVNGTVTGTYNNATVFYNIAHMNTPIAQGQIT